MKRIVLSKLLAVMPLFFRVVFLLFLAGLLGGLANLFLPHRIAWVEDWGHYVEAQAYQEGFALANRGSVQRAVDDGNYLLLAARPMIDYEEGHIDGALSLPSDGVEDDMDVFPILTPEDQLMIYCSNHQCDDSLVLARYLRENGFTNLVIYAGGWTDWQRGFAEEEK